MHWVSGCVCVCVYVSYLKATPPVKLIALKDSLDPKKILDNYFQTKETNKPYP